MGIKVFMNTWGNYNTNGADGGKWIALPMGNEELTIVLNDLAVRMNDCDPEWFINDYELENFTFDISEYDNVFDLNKIAERLDELSNYELTKLTAYNEAINQINLENIVDIIDNLDNIEFYKDMNLEDVAYDIIAECYDLPEIALRYFDYEAFGRDLGFDGYYETHWGVIRENR